MPSPTNLMDAYADELRDLWSANDQMQEIVRHFVREAMDKRLKRVGDGRLADRRTHGKAEVAGGGGWRAVASSIAAAWKGS